MAMCDECRGTVDGPCVVEEIRRTIGLQFARRLQIVARKHGLLKKGSRNVKSKNKAAK